MLLLIAVSRRIIVTVTIKYKPVFSDVFCDRLTVTLKVKPEQYDEVKFNMNNMIENGYARKDYKWQYRLSMRLGIGEDNDSSTLIQCSPHPFLSNYSFFRIELNPHRLGSEGLSELKLRIDEILPNGYDDLVRSGVCTRFDAALDLKYISIESLAFSYPKMRLSKAFYNSGSVTNYIQSYYIGGDKNKRQICIYDKVAQIKEYNQKNLIKKDVPSFPVTRIEVRNKKRVRVSELINIDNQFKPLEVLLLSRFPDIDWVFGLFVKAVRLEGLLNALLALPKYERAKYKKILKVANASFWKPDKHWEKWTDVIGEIYKPLPSKLAV